MTTSRRAVIAAAVAGMSSGLAACGNGTSGESGTPSPTPEEDSTAPEGDPVTTDPGGEKAEPDPNDKLPAQFGVAVSDGLVHAPSYTEFLSWSPDGNIVGRLPLADYSVRDFVGDWSLADGVLALGAQDRYSAVTVALPEGVVLGELRVEITVEPDPRLEPTTPAPDDGGPTVGGPVSLATDGAFVAATFVDGTFRISDVAADAVSSELVPDQFVPPEEGRAARVEVVWAPSGLLVVHSASNAVPVEFWDPDSSAMVKVLAASPPNPQHVLFAADAPRMVVTQYTQEVQEMPYKVFDTDTDDVLAEGVLPDIATAIALSPDGTLLASAGGFGRGDDMRLIHISNLDTGEVFTMERDSYVARSLAFSADGRTLYSHNNAKGIVAWDLASLSETITFEMPA